MKIPKTHTFDKQIYEKFCKLSEKLSINKSKFLENKIKEFIEENEKLS